MKVRKTLPFSTLLCLLLSAASTPQVWGADAIAPAQEPFIGIGSMIID